MKPEEFLIKNVTCSHDKTEVNIKTCLQIPGKKKHVSQIFCSSKGEVKFAKADNATGTTCLVQYR